ATGFYSVDGDGKFLLVNQTLADWFGRSPGELVESGTMLGDFIVADGQQRGPAYAPYTGGAEGAPRGGARPDLAARMGRGAETIAPPVPAPVRRRAGRHRAARHFGPYRGSQPRARRTAWHRGG